jgi:hypothetical protein
MFGIQHLNDVQYIIKKISQDYRLNDLKKYNQSKEIENLKFEIIEFDFANDLITLKVTKK